MFNKKNKLIIKVYGMSCEHCAKKVEDSLKEIPEVLKVNVNLKSKNVEITLKELINQSIIIDKIEQIGYKVEV